MINQMNKHLNHLSMAKLLGVEQQEHGLKEKPTREEMLQLEMKEHNLKKKPSLQTAMKAESYEHYGPLGRLVIEGSRKQHEAANKIYRGR